MSEHDNKHELEHGHGHDHSSENELGLEHSSENELELEHEHEHELELEHEHEHEHGHDHDHDHSHEHPHGHKDLGGKRRIVAKVKNASGSIYIDRQMHDSAIVVSASLFVESKSGDLCACISGELEAAAREVKEQGGIIGHLKASVSTTSTCMISITDVDAMAKDSPLRRARITLAAIMFLLDPEVAENIIRKALVRVRASLIAAL